MLFRSREVNQVLTPLETETVEQDREYLEVVVLLVTESHLRALEQRRTAYGMAGSMGRCVQPLSGTRRAGGTH